MNIGKNFKTIRRFAIAAIFTTSTFATSTLAHASLFTYSLSGVKTSAGNLTGTIVINSVTDLITSANIMLHDTALGDPTFTTVTSASAWNGESQDYISSAADPALNYWGGQFELRFDTANVGTGTLAICISGSLCGTNTGQFAQVDAYTGKGNYTYDVTKGSLKFVGLAPPPATSEPSSLLLLGTGMLSVAGVAFRRFAKAAGSVDAA